MWQASLAALNVTEADPLYDLISNHGALSTALRSKDQVLSVQVIKQELATATIEEQALLNISEANSLIREVWLRLDHKPVVHARVIAPLRTYLQFQTTFDALGNQLLGETLLYTRSYTRTPFQYARVNDQLARRSIFDLQGYTILVQENFEFKSCDLQLSYNQP